MGDFLLEVEGVGAAAQVRSFIGKERLNRPHRFRVVATFEPGMDDAALVALVGMPATLAFEGHPEARRVPGVLTEVALLERADSGRAVVEVVLASRLARLGERRTSRVYQDATIPETIGRVLALHRIPLLLDLSRKHPKRDTLAQYRETDLDFVRRLASEAHLAFFSLDAEKGHDETVIFTDAARAFPAIHGDPALEVRTGQVGDDAMGFGEHQARVSALRKRAATSSALVRRYDPLRPRTEHRSAARWSVGQTGPGVIQTLEDFPDARDDRGLHYEHHGDFDELGVERDEAALHLAAARARAMEIAGSSPSVRLAAGRRVSLSGPEWTDAAGEHVLARVDHAFRGEGLPGRKERYEATFRAIPVAVFPHAKPVRRAPVEVVQTGIVVGPPGEEIFTDEHGRVRVQLHWDLDGDHDGRASTWIRVAQPWAGNGFGASFVPRVGMEVLVSFIGGDPDRPVVIGCLHHAAHPPPFALPALRATSGILSRVTPGDPGGSSGSNELSIHDAKGKELVRARSERDLELTSKEDTRFDVGGDRRTRIAGDDSLIIDGQRRVKVGGLAVEVTGESDSTSYGDVSATFIGKHETHHHDVANVHYGAGLFASSDGPVTVHVEHEAALLVGTGDTPATVNVDGNLTAAASRTITLRAEDAIRLQVGTTVLEVTADGVKIDGKTIALTGQTITAEGDGPKLTLSDEAELLTQKVTILTKKGGLVMEEQTKLWGKPLALNPPPDEAKAEGEEDEPKKKPFKVKLTDAMMEPYANKRWVLFANGARQEGETTGEGAIDVEIDEESELVEVTCWIDEFPTGRQRKWTIRVAELPPSSSLPGALLRLHNLGYYEGKIPEKAGPSEEAAIRWFQKEHDLEPTGRLDGETAAELEQVHGS